MATKKKTVTVKKGRSVPPSTQGMKPPTPVAAYRVSELLDSIAEKAVTAVLEKIGPEMRDTFAAMERKLAPRTGCVEGHVPADLPPATPPPTATETRPVVIAYRSAESSLESLGAAVHELMGNMLLVVGDNYNQLREKASAELHQDRPPCASILESMLYDLKDKIVEYTAILVAFNASQTV